MSHERMPRAEKELEKEINALMRRAEILDAQDDKRYGKGKLGSDLPDERRRRLMQSGGSYLQGYNCQLAVHSDHQVILAVGVSNQPPDVEHLEPMLQRITAQAGQALQLKTHLRSDRRPEKSITRNHRDCKIRICNTRVRAHHSTPFTL